MGSSRPVLLCASVFALAVAGGTAFARNIPVPGEDWPTIQAGIDDAANGDVVWVAQGTYRENIDFKGKAIRVTSLYGTYPWVVATTIIDGGQNGSVVTFNSGETAASVLQGFTITNGNGRDVFGVSWGGGVYCRYASPTLTDNVISGNSAYYGGGMYCEYCSAILTNNSISGNAGGQGGGLMCDDHSWPILTHNTITGNSASFEGGGVMCNYCSPTLTNNTVSGNSAADNGGGVYCYSASPPLTNNAISGNSAPYGGGVLCDNYSSPILKNTIVAYNTKGGGLYVTGSGQPVVTYCDFYRNTGGNYVNWTDPTGTKGNISAEPLFADAWAGDFRLESHGGRWTGTAWVKDPVSSPCIDAGDPGSAFNLEPSPNGGRINMGFDGNTSYASKTPPPSVVQWLPQGNTASPATKIKVIFSTTMAKTSVQSAFSIVPAKPGKFSWSGKQLIFTPTTPLAGNKSYKVTLAGSAKSLAGVKLGTPFTWTFKTRTAASPALVTAAAASTRSGFTQVTVNLAAAASVQVRVLNLAGREVAVLAEKELPQGVSSLLWDGRSAMGTKAPAGRYLLRVTARGQDGSQAQALASLSLGR